jgi:hypothetical protein
VFGANLFWLELQKKVLRHHKSRAAIHAYPNGKQSYPQIDQATTILLPLHVPFPPPTFFHKHKTTSTAHLEQKYCSFSHHSEIQPSCNSRIINMREVISLNGKSPRRAASPLFRLRYKPVNDFLLTLLTI